ncbi:putative FRE ferric reductase-like transmembrane component [Aureobasidium subglaciale]|nr:putative FRE ferric reductase-like transmembrane component [Aureobasidium subglaciale]KAI5231285.1 putative FRE ferric reductase-like transmembrane component [Aureobasidium subglaciale]KAI5234083.1 putative FRE ferric reductase-like transmembrane component [Aureobasidium subglaciale]KAI5267673.1 putative FRE ferric reductase-like transmembrane component [Aureobasidium subglaciale]
MLFWHCKNFLTSWHYLWATTAMWFISYMVRLFFLNWTNYFRLSWLVGEEAAVTLMPENAIKVTIPTQVKWKPGQYVYLRMPGISVFENHPFTIASLWSDDFPSQYGEQYRDMVLVFRPFGGFTKKVLDSALDNGPWHTYRAFIDGPYGGMRRSMDSFDHVVLFAGGSGITALVSQLLDLIKRLRDGKAVTKSVQVIWALKRPETMEWFKEELRICREFAPPGTVQCQFYITAAKRQPRTGELVSAQTPTRPISMMFYNKVNETFQNIANNRLSTISANTNRNSALIAEEAAGDPEREKALRRENEDRLRPLPQAHLLPMRSASRSGRASPPPSELSTPRLTLAEKRKSQQMSIPLPDPAAPAYLREGASPQGEFDFGFPSTPTEFQKNLMRFAFLPAAVKSTKTGWSTEYGRPDIPFMLREMSQEWTGRRTCVFVCGPPSMRVDVSNTVAELQRTVWNNPGRDEVYLHAENYAI